jgi:hypothetical protein
MPSHFRNVPVIGVQPCAKTQDRTDVLETLSSVVTGHPEEPRAGANSEMSF